MRYDFERDDLSELKSKCLQTEGPQSHLPHSNTSPGEQVCYLLFCMISYIGTSNKEMHHSILSHYCLFTVYWRDVQYLIVY